MSETITLPRAVVAQALHVATAAGYPVALIATLKAALEQPVQCACGDRPKGKCPGEWEPGCDLGNNPKYARRVPLRREWRGLKEWEINDGLDQLPTEDLCNWSFRMGVYFAEAVLRSKNHE